MRHRRRRHLASQRRWCLDRFWRGFDRRVSRCYVMLRFHRRK